MIDHVVIRRPSRAARLRFSLSPLVVPIPVVVRRRATLVNDRWLSEFCCRGMSLEAKPTGSGGVLPALIGGGAARRLPWLLGSVAELMG